MGVSCSGVYWGKYQAGNIQKISNPGCGWNGMRPIRKERWLSKLFKSSPAHEYVKPPELQLVLYSFWLK